MLKKYLAKKLLWVYRNQILILRLQVFKKLPKPQKKQPENFRAAFYNYFCCAV